VRESINPLVRISIVIEPNREHYSLFLLLVRIRGKHLGSSNPLISISVDPRRVCEGQERESLEESRRASTERGVEGVVRFHAVISIWLGKTRRILEDSFAWTHHAGKLSRSFAHPYRSLDELSQ
jgi:hypothetical protein